MKLSKSEALDLYVLVASTHSIARSHTDLFNKLRAFLTEADDSSSDESRADSAVEEGAEQVDVEVDDEEEELELPTADAPVDPEDLHALPAVSATLPDGSRSKVEFEELDGGPVDLVIEGTGEIMKNVSHVTRTANELSIFNDDGWTTFVVKKYAKGWTSLLESGKTYIVER